MHPIFYYKSVEISILFLEPFPFITETLVHKSCADWWPVTRLWLDITNLIPLLCANWGVWAGAREEENAPSGRHVTHA